MNVSIIFIVRRWIALMREIVSAKDWEIRTDLEENRDQHLLLIGSKILPRKGRKVRIREIGRGMMDE